MLMNKVIKWQENSGSSDRPSNGKGGGGRHSRYLVGEQRL